MRRYSVIISLVFLLCPFLWAEEKKSCEDSIRLIRDVLPAAVPQTGEYASAAHFRERYQTGSLINYINYISDDMLWESETSGGWANADRMLFSIRGNSYEWNRFYLNGFRLDSRFHSGSMLYVPDMQQTSLRTDVERGIIYLDDEDEALEHVNHDHFSATGNIGGIGGISPGTRQIINIFHKSAEERLWKPIEVRNHQLWAGELSASYGIPYCNGKLQQRLYANFGTRRIVRFNEGGVISSADPEPGFYDAPYYKVQLDGQLPLGNSVMGKKLSLHYVLDMQKRSDLYSEFGYGSSEVADYKGYSASLFLKSEKNNLTTGLTYALHDICRQDRNYERNIVDQDGEGFDPWYADGRLHEISWPVRYLHFFSLFDERLVLSLDSYNSLLHFSQAADSWGHNLYVQYEDQGREDWYRYDFTGHDFTAGMLENTLTLRYEYDLCRWSRFRADASAALDGILLRDKALMMPTWEAEMAFDFHCKQWFDASIILGNYRTKYTWNQLRLLSSDYQNGTLSGQYAPYPYYGGEYLSVRKGIQQPQYALVDLPIEFTVHQKGNKKHKFSILSTARLYYHNWQITHNPDYTGEIGEKPYLLTYQQPVEGAGMFALPLYLSNTLKYTYQGPKVFFSLSWQSYQMSGLTTLGNGAENNSISTLSYSMLYPTLGENLKNPESPVRALGRLDQDKAFICRVQLGANITQNVQYMLNFHFQDGTPICNYVTDNGRLYARNTKGINPSDGHFGMRKDAFFNFDMKLSYRGNINMRNQQLDARGALPFSVELLCYNIYDFGTTWYEYSFDQYMEHGRRTLAEVIPRGLTLKLSIGLSKNR